MHTRTIRGIEATRMHVLCSNVTVIHLNQLHVIYIYIYAVYFLHARYGTSYVAMCDPLDWDVTKRDHVFSQTILLKCYIDDCQQNRNI
jgi:hypothetical protein